MNSQLKESACHHLMQLCINFRDIIFHMAGTEMKLPTLNARVQWNANGCILIEMKRCSLFLCLEGKNLVHTNR